MYLIEFGLISALVLFGYLDWRFGFGKRQPVDAQLRNMEADFDPRQLDLRRLRRDIRREASQGWAPDAAAPRSAGESRESELARQLVTGSLQPAMYRRLMSELAHAPEDVAGLR